MRGGKGKQAGKLLQQCNKGGVPITVSLRRFIHNIPRLQSAQHFQHQGMLSHRRKETRQIIQTSDLTYFVLFWNHTEQVPYIKKFWLNLCRSLIFQADDINFS